MNLKMLAIFVRLQCFKQPVTNTDDWPAQLEARLILGLRPANERQRYFVTMSLIGWAQT